MSSVAKQPASAPRLKRLYVMFKNASRPAVIIVSFQRWLKDYGLQYFLIRTKPVFHVYIFSGPEICSGLSPNEAA